MQLRTARVTDARVGLHSLDVMPNELSRIDGHAVLTSRPVGSVGRPTPPMFSWPRPQGRMAVSSRSFWASRTCFGSYKKNDRMEVDSGERTLSDVLWRVEQVLLVVGQCGGGLSPLHPKVRKRDLVEHPSHLQPVRWLKSVAH